MTLPFRWRGGFLACAYAAKSAEADLLAELVPRDTFMNCTFVTRGMCP